MSCIVCLVKPLHYHVSSFTVVSVYWIQLIVLLFNEYMLYVFSYPEINIKEKIRA